MINEQVKNHLNALQDISSKLLELNCILEVLSGYCNTQSDNDEINNVTPIVDILKTEIGLVREELVTAADNVVSLLPL